MIFGIFASLHFKDFDSKIGDLRESGPEERVALQGFGVEDLDLREFGPEEQIQDPGNQDPKNRFSASTFLKLSF